MTDYVAPSPIISLGDLVADVILHVPTLPIEAGQHQLALEIGLEPGGGSNLLIAGVRLGHPMATIDIMGDDVWGYRVVEILWMEGIDVTPVRHHGTTTRVVVVVSEAGEHVFLGNYGEGDRLELDREHLSIIPEAGALFCSGYSLEEPRLREVSLEVMALAQQHDIPVFFDSGPLMGNVPADLRDRSLTLIDTLMLAEEELPFVTDGDARDLLAKGPSMVVIKRGPEGCRIHTQEGTLDSPGYPVNVVDTTAAGDSFDAAFMIASLRGWSLDAVARYSNAVGAAKVQKLGGGRNVPNLEDVLEVIERFAIDLPMSADEQRTLLQEMHTARPPMPARNAPFLNSSALISGERNPF